MWLLLTALQISRFSMPSENESRFHMETLDSLLKINAATCLFAFLSKQLDAHADSF